MSKEMAIAIVIVTFIVFIIFPLILALCEKIIPKTYNDDVIKKAFKLIEEEKEIGRIKELSKYSFEDMGGGM